jgi:hypothetical protein
LLGQKAPFAGDTILTMVTISQRAVVDAREHNRRTDWREWDE